MKFTYGQKCPTCKEEILYNHMPVEYARLHQGRKVCKYCDKWFHRNCLLGQIACFDCFNSCTDQETRQILLRDSHNIINGRNKSKTCQDESRDIVALQLWMLFKLEHRFDEKEISKVMKFDLEWVSETIQIMRDKEVITSDEKVSLDVSDEQPLTFYIALVLNCCLVQGLIDRKKDETHSSS